VSSRTYLSIGDVLTLLREEFPDVTISKIRFLESQGLVNPERSPSGYRKFFEHDVERLRWVLRQQREHFLPLKVIRDRLADGDLDEGADLVNGKSGEPHASARAPRAEEQPTKADEEAMARILADASRRTANMPEAAQMRRGLQVVPDHAASAASAASAEGSAERARAGVGASGKSAAAGAAAGPSGPPPRDVVAGPTDAHAPRGGGAGTPAPSPPPAGAPGAGQAAAPPQPGAGQGSKAPPGGATTGIVTGASLTVDELCGACDLSAAEVSGLESFGLIEPVMVAGIPTYDEDALTMAKVAAAFRAYGIEPRHLRSYRNSVDREVGLIEQVVIPLLRQRNPESRQRAVEAAEQLASLGQSMRATLLRQALRRHLGG
jgi:DNA-binding transcriptional MerR regulator